jgi:cystathionine beta-lyase/cystathionine gamma-synthase
MDISYIINELGEDRESYLNSVAPPIFQTAMFSSKTVAEMRELLQYEAERPFYTRGNNPTTDLLRKKMAALEKAEDALIFGSGSAAIAAAVLAHLETGDHVVCVKKPYSWTNKLMTVFLPRFGIEVTLVDGTEAQNYEDAIRTNTKVLYLESPNSWTYELQDIEAVVKIAKKHGLITVMDNSWATPLYQTPIEMGVDLVAHSGTKYIAGHSDAVAGVLCGSQAMIRKIFASEYMALGGIVSPFNSWLLLRGLRTLPIRMERVSKTTEEVVAFLDQHPLVEKVYFPFLKSHPQYELAKKQMLKPSGLFSIQVKTDTIEEAEKFCNHLKRFLLAVSWGAYESLIFPACTLYASEIYKSPDLPWNMVRISIGLDEPEVLIKDLEQALKAMKE